MLNPSKIQSSLKGYMMDQIFLIMSSPPNVNCKMSKVQTAISLLENRKVKISRKRMTQANMGMSLLKVRQMEQYQGGQYLRARLLEVIVGREIVWLLMVRYSQEQSLRETLQLNCRRSLFEADGLIQQVWYGKLAVIISEDSVSKRAVDYSQTRMAFSLGILRNNDTRKGELFWLTVVFVRLV